MFFPMKKGTRYPSTLQRPMMITLALSLNTVPDGYDKMKLFLMKKLRAETEEAEEQDQEQAKVQSDHLLSELILVRKKEINSVDLHA